MTCWFTQDPKLGGCSSTSRWQPWTRKKEEVFDTTKKVQRFGLRVIILKLICPKLSSLLNSFLCPHHTTCGILVPWPGIKPGLSAVRTWNPHHWATGEFPPPFFICLPRPSYGELQTKTWRHFYSLSFRHTPHLISQPILLALPLKHSQELNLSRRTTPLATSFEKTISFSTHR